MRTDLRVGDHIRVKAKFTVEPFQMSRGAIRERMLIVESISISKLTAAARDVKTGTLEEIDCIDIL